MERKTGRRWFFAGRQSRLFLLCLCLLVSDLSAKFLATQYLRFHLNYEDRKYRKSPSFAETEGRELVPILGPAGRYLRLRLVFNSKGMMGLGKTQDPKSLFLGLAWLVFLLFGGFYLMRAGYFLQTRLLPLAWILFLSGSMGNWIDRLFLKSLSDRSWVFGLAPREGFVRGVTDFVDAIWYGNVFSTWPVLRNLAFERWPVFNLADMFLFLGMLLFFVDFLQRSLTAYLGLAWPSTHKVQKKSGST